MAKFDKEMMKKQHFWLLLIPLFIGLLLAWIGLFFGVADETAAKTKENDDEKKKIESTKAQPRKTLDLYDVQKNELFDLRSKRWQEMWDLQQDIYDWPQSLGDEQVAKIKDQKFGTMIHDSSFLNNFRDHYSEEYKTIADEAAPLSFAGGWQSVLRYVPKWTRNPESEEVWLAAEDFWVQREIVRALAEVNKEAAKFTQVKPPAGQPDDPRHRTFENRIWRVELEIVDEKGATVVKGKLKNKTDRLQPFNVTNELVLKIWLSDDGKPFVFPIEGVSWEGGKEDKITYVPKKHTVFEGNPQQLARVEQVFDVRTAPIKRVDALKLGYLSSRHSMADLQMTAFSTTAIEEEGKTAAAAPAGGFGGPGGLPGPGGPTGGPGGPTPGMVVPGFGGGPGGDMAGGAAAASGSRTFNGLARQRYIHRTDQVRAMPIGMAVVADQAFVQDALTALANCKLRFQTVQTHLTRFRGTLSYAPVSGGGPGMPGGFVPPSGPAGPGEGDAPIPGGGSSDRGGSGPPPTNPGFPGFPGGFAPPGVPSMPSMPGGFGGFGGFGGMRSSSEDQVANNLVEVGIYGIASLYEKYQPPEAKKDDTSTTTGPTTTGPTTGPMPTVVPMPPTTPMNPPTTPPTAPTPPTGTEPMPPKK